MPLPRDIPQGDAAGEDPLVCYCMRVTRGELISAIRGGATTLEALRDRTRANTGCGTCRIDLLQLLAEHAPADEGTEPSGPDEASEPGPSINPTE